MDMSGCLLLAFLLHQASKACASRETDMAGAEGRSITFRLQNLKGENLAWSFRGETILSIKLGESPEASYYDDSYKTRVTFPENGSALTISQLRKDDGGTYIAKTTMFKASFTLHVYSELQEPAVTCVAWNCSADGCRYTLHCAVEPPGDNSFSWSNGKWLEGEGPEVEVEALPPGGSDPLLYTCTARNPVSSRNATVSPAAVCADSYSSSHAGIIAASVISMLLLLAVILVIIKAKGRKEHDLPAPGAHGTEVAADYVTVYAEVSTAPQMQMQNFPDARKNDPKKMPAPGAETSKTIYSTIQATAQMDDKKMDNSTPGSWEQKSP